MYSYCTRQQKGVKYVSPIAKGFSHYICWNSTESKGYLVYVPHTRKIISSYDVVFDEKQSSTLAYTPRPYSETMAMRPSVSYIPCNTSSKEQTGDIITFTQFEEGGLLSENRDDSGDESNDDSIMPPLLRLEEKNMLDSGDESDDEPRVFFTLRSA